MKGQEKSVIGEEALLRHGQGRKGGEGEGGGGVVGCSREQDIWQKGRAGSREAVEVREGLGGCKGTQSSCREGTEGGGPGDPCPLCCTQCTTTTTTAAAAAAASVQVNDIC